jgi:hypothetical protein
MNQSLLQTVIEQPYPPQPQQPPEKPPQQQEQPHELADVCDATLQATQAFVGAQGEIGTVTKYAMPNIVPPKTVIQHINDMLREENGVVQ